jgi:hypothetical protein
MKKPSAVIIGIASGLGAVIGSSAVNLLFKSRGTQVSFDRKLVRVADEINKTLPMMVDRDTRIDSTVPGPGNRFTYVCTLVDLVKEDVDSRELEQTVRPRLIANYKSNPQMKELRERRIELHYQYRDKNWESLFEVIVTPKDF